MNFSKKEDLINMTNVRLHLKSMVPWLDVHQKRNWVLLLKLARFFLIKRDGNCFNVEVKKKRVNLRDAERLQISYTLHLLERQNTNILKDILSH